MTTSNNTATAAMLIRRPISEVYDAFINPEITTKFWFTHSSGKLEVGKKVNWIWEMYQLTVPVEVKELIPEKQIVIDWGEGEHKSSAKWVFKEIAPNKTYVTITNYNFKGKGIALTNQVIDSTGGFTLVVAGLKAWLEHGIKLNLVGDKFPKEVRNE